MHFLNKTFDILVIILVNISQMRKHLIKLNNETEFIIHKPLNACTTTSEPCFNGSIRQMIISRVLSEEFSLSIYTRNNSGLSRH